METLRVASTKPNQKERSPLEERESLLNLVGVEACREGICLRLKGVHEALLSFEQARYLTFLLQDSFSEHRRLSREEVIKNANNR